MLNLFLTFSLWVWLGVGSDWHVRWLKMPSALLEVQCSGVSTETRGIICFCMCLFHILRSPGPSVVSPRPPFLKSSRALWVLVDQWPFPHARWSVWGSSKGGMVLVWNSGSRRASEQSLGCWSERDWESERTVLAPLLWDLAGKPTSPTGSCLDFLWGGWQTGECPAQSPGCPLRWPCANQQVQTVLSPAPALG